MSDSEDSAVTYTSVYTDSEPRRVFWGTDEEAHDPDFVPEPVYPEYIPLEDEHVLPAEEQPLPPVNLPTAESPGYVAESDPEEDPKYEDDEEQDASADSTVVIPVVELVSSPEGTKPVSPPPSIDITTTGARISVRLQASVSLPS
nr:hypothetical protein [Tanacetum cinerariifolium]